ncbi:MAG: type II toxin-antitoxin system RelE/ParE family toxin [Thermosynechococcaceae cyanobacterium]
MPRLIIRPLAEQDLDEIWDYIAISDPEQAEKVLRHLYAKMGTLAHKPYMGRERKEIAVGLRSFPVVSHVIFYDPLPDGIEIVRVLHGARDIQDIFEP